MKLEIIFWKVGLVVASFSIGAWVQSNERLHWRWVSQQRSDTCYVDYSELPTHPQAGSQGVNQSTGYLSIPGTAFLPRYTECDYTRRSGSMCTNDGSCNIYYAPVFLPHNATVTGLYYHFYDYSSSYDTLIELHRCRDTGIRDVMAKCNSSGTPGKNYCWDTTIDYDTVNNANYSYIAWLHIPSTCSDMKAYRVAISYSDS